MNELIINPKFESMLCELSEEESQILEQKLLKEGFRGALTTTMLNGQLTLIDGHNRLKICKRHGIKPKFEEMFFESEEEIEMWILHNQMGQRNLTEMQKSCIRRDYYKANIREGGRPKKKLHMSICSFAPETKGPTTEIVGKKFKVSAATIDKDIKVASGIDKIAEVSVEAKNKILSGKSGVTKQDMMDARKKTNEELEEIAKAIEDDEYETYKKSSIKKATEQIESSICERSKSEPESSWTPPERSNIYKSKLYKSTRLSDNTPEQRALIRQTCEESIARNEEAAAEMEAQYTVDDLIKEIKLECNQITGRIRTIFSMHDNIVSSPECKPKIMTALTETEAAIQQLKGLFI